MALTEMEFSEGFSSSSISKASRVTSGTLDNSICYKQDGVVTISARLHTMSDIVAYGDFFIIPEGYRPHETTLLMCYYELANGAKGNFFVAVNTGGNVSFYFSSGQNITLLLFSGSYAV